jgi:hypothetical protein
MANEALNDIAVRFVTTVRMFQKERELKPELFSEEDRELLLAVAKAAGFECFGIVPKKIVGHYREQGGERTGETYPINATCPFTILSRDDDFRIREESRVNDHVGATSWLDRTVAFVHQNRECKENSALAADVAEIIMDSIPLEPIVLDGFGNRLREYPPEAGMKHTRDQDKISSTIGVHVLCNGWVDMKPSSKDWHAIVCRCCHLRIQIPAHLKTYGDLRKYLMERLKSEAYRERMLGEAIRQAQLNAPMG